METESLLPLLRVVGDAARDFHGERSMRLVSWMRCAPELLLSGGGLMGALVPFGLLLPKSARRDSRLAAPSFPSWALATGSAPCWRSFTSEKR